MLLNKKGSVYYIVLLFAVVTVISASIYVTGQFNFTKSFRKDPAKLQSLLNARTGIWYGLALLDKQLSNKIAKQQEGLADTTDKSSLFGEDLFDDEKPRDSSTQDEAVQLLGSDMDTLEVYPFKNDSVFGPVNIFLHHTGNFRILESTSLFKRQRRKVIVKLGSRPFFYPDTVLYLGTPGMPEGEGDVDGRIAFLQKSIDESDSLQQKRFHVDFDELRTIVNNYRQPLVALGDSMELEEPLTVQYSDECLQIPDTVGGALFIDGSYRDVIWKEKRKVYVLEELQVTGEVRIENVTFVVAGDVKILDQAVLNSVEIFTASRLFCANESKVLASSAIACGDVEIYEEAQILEKSVIISAGLSGGNRTSPKTQGDLDEDGLPSQEQKKKQLDEDHPSREQDVPTQKKGTKKSRKKSKPYSLFVRDQAIVDGVLIELRELGGIKTDMETVIKGVLWSRARVCHVGRMAGVIKAFVLVDQTEPMNVSRNYINGTIKRLSSIDEYFMPYYFGKSTIVSWQEK